MEDMKFLAYLSTEGLTIEEARNALVLLEVHINDLTQRTEIGSLVQKTRINWEPGHDGKLVATGQVEEDCMRADNFSALPQNIEALAMARALRSWLKDAIKYYECVTDTQSPDLVDCDNIYAVYASLGKSLNKYIMDVLVPMLPTPPALHKIDDDTLTAEDYFAALSVNDLARYYAAQAGASTIGEYIHPQGNYAKARTDLVTKSQHPSQLESGHVAVRTYVPAISIDQVNKMFFALQASQRDHQKDVNSIKYKAEDSITASQQQYFERRQLLETENMAMLKEYNDRIKGLIKSINDAASQLRIAIPAKASQTLNAIMAK